MNWGKRHIPDITDILWTFIRQIDDYSHDWFLLGNFGDYLVKDCRALICLFTIIAHIAY